MRRRMRVYEEGSEEGIGYKHALKHPYLTYLEHWE